MKRTLALSLFLATSALVIPHSFAADATPVEQSAPTAAPAPTPAPEAAVTTPVAPTVAAPTPPTAAEIAPVVKPTVKSAKSAKADRKKSEDKTQAAVKPAGGSDIVATLADNKDFKTLHNFIQAAGLADTLKSAGPYTLFAPTDAAFAKMSAGDIEDLLRPRNKAKLRALLTYHLVPGKMTKADFTGKQLAQSTLQGSILNISSKTNEPVMIGSAKLGAEIAVSNGVIYSIDAVQMPVNFNKQAM